jgi:predicted TIM-barrel fold metal-dependent hydrolase
MSERESRKIWANSGDSHATEPPGLWAERLPAALAARMPRTEPLDERHELLHVDGRTFKRRKQWNPEVSEAELVQAGQLARGREGGKKALDLYAPDGSSDTKIRLKDLDHEGIWGECIYASLGLWTGLIKDPALYREGVKVQNDWLKETFVDATNRCVPAAEISTLSVEDAVAEAIRAAKMGFKAINLPTLLGGGDIKGWNDEVWEPLWATAEALGLVLASHIGSEEKNPEGPGFHTYRGPGGAVLNYVETAFGGQRLTAMLIASGVLDRHPKLKLLISEGGGSWMPFLADRMEESYDQHSPWVRPKLSRSPTEIMRAQVYASFMHDRSAVAIHTALGYKNILWGSDYPHMEGTYGHTQKTLHALFDALDEPARYRITRGAFLELFPHVGEPPVHTEQSVATR